MRSIQLVVLILVATLPFQGFPRSISAKTEVWDVGKVIEHLKPYQLAPDKKPFADQQILIVEICRDVFGDKTFTLAEPQRSDFLLNLKAEDRLENHMRSNGPEKLNPEQARWLKSYRARAGGMQNISRQSNIPFIKAWIDFQLNENDRGRAVMWGYCWNSILPAHEQKYSSHIFCNEIMNYLKVIVPTAEVAALEKKITIQREACKAPCKSKGIDLMNCFCP